MQGTMKPTKMGQGCWVEMPGGFDVALPPELQRQC